MIANGPRLCGGFSIFSLHLQTSLMAKTLQNQEMDPHNEAKLVGAAELATASAAVPWLEGV